MRLRKLKYALVALAVLFICGDVCAFTFTKVDKEERKKQEIDDLQKRFEWWPTDAQPQPVKDEKRGGYWWMPRTPGTTRPWGNRGYIYVYKIIYDYKEEELPPAKASEPRPSLLIKKIIKNVKVYFDFDKAELRDDAVSVLEGAVASLRRNPETSILITGNCDIRGSEQYNEKLGRRRGDSVKKFMLDSGVPEKRVMIVSRGKLDAIAPVTDLAGMAKDRNAQFMIAEVEEVMIPAPSTQGEAEGAVPSQEAEQIPEGATQIEEGKYLIEKEEIVESEVKVSTKTYVTKKGDTLWKIAERELGEGRRWNTIYELNKDKIKNPNKLSAGKRLVIPVE
ncbi:MAG: OmpA family protein [Candidatus Omnitrophota bacterium]